MKPAQSLVDLLSKVFGERNMSNIMADFEPVGQEITAKMHGEMRQVVLDALFLSFCRGMASAINSESQFNRNYNNRREEEPEERETRA